jgi:hypothetical protein
VGVLLISTIIGFALSAIALNQRGNARDNEAEAERSAEVSQSLALASGAQAALGNGNVDQARALVNAANQIDSPPAFAQRVLFDTASTPGTMAQFVGGGGWIWALELPRPVRTSGGCWTFGLVSPVYTMLLPMPLYRK